MDINLINPFINATLNVLETMAFIKPEAGKPYLKKDDFAREMFPVLSDLLVSQMELFPSHLINYAS